MTNLSAILLKLYKSYDLLPKLLLIGCGIALLLGSLSAQSGPSGPHNMRKHVSTKVSDWEPISATESLNFIPKVSFRRGENEMQVQANAIPLHKVGRFPNRRNPHTIREQKLSFTLPLSPIPLEKPIPLHNESGRGAPNTPFGRAANGALFDPGTAEFFLGDRGGDWNYEALSGSVILGLDTHHGHVQPNGSYHYHGLPIGLLEKLKVRAGEHSPLIGFAMDGYPIYALYGYRDAKNSKSAIVKLRSSWQVKGGKRPVTGKNPGGNYDGTFSRDYEYRKGSGDLDECNGRFTVTKEYPGGTYAYFLTERWPVIPRYFRAEPLKLRGARARP